MSDKQSEESSKSTPSTGSYLGGHLDDPSIHLRDIFGSQWSFDDDPSVVVRSRARKKAKDKEPTKQEVIKEEQGEEEVETGTASVQESSHGQETTSSPQTTLQGQQQHDDDGEEEYDDRKPPASTTVPTVDHTSTYNADDTETEQSAHGQDNTASHQQATTPPAKKKLTSLERIRRPLNPNYNTKGDENTVVSATPSVSIHLRDVFGSKWSFEDDPSVVQSRKEDNDNTGSPHEKEDENDDKMTATATKTTPRRTNSAESGAASSVGSTGSRRSTHSQQQQGLRHRKQSAHTSPQQESRRSIDRIRRPAARTNSKEGEESITSSPSKKRITPMRSNSFVSKVKLGPLGDDSEDSLLRGNDSAVLGKISWDDDHDNNDDDGQENMAQSLPLNQSYMDYDDTVHTSLSNMDIEIGEATGGSAVFHASSTHSHNSSIFQDEFSESKNTDGDKLLLPVPTSAYALNPSPDNPFETPQRTCCISCSICTVFLVVWFSFQAFTLLWWDPDPFLPSRTVTTVPPKAVGPPIEEILGPNVPESTLTAIHHIWDSPQSTAFRWLHADPNWVDQYSQERRRQRFALACLYFATNPPYQHNWNTQGRWLSYDTSECHWLMTSDDGDSSLNLCHKQEDQNPPNAQRRLQDKDDMVIRSLPLQNNNLVGPIPPEISMLSSLTFVRLDQNGLTGDIPSDWLNSDQKMTTLQLQGNPTLVGELPSQWCAIADLQFDCKSSGQGFICGCDCPC